MSRQDEIAILAVAAAAASSVPMTSPEQALASALDDFEVERRSAVGRSVPTALSIVARDVHAALEASGWTLTHAASDSGTVGLTDEMGRDKPGDEGKDRTQWKEPTTAVNQPSTTTTHSRGSTGARKSPGRTATTASLSTTSNPPGSTASGADGSATSPRRNGIRRGCFGGPADTPVAVVSSDEGLREVGEESDEPVPFYSRERASATITIAGGEGLLIRVAEASRDCSHRGGCGCLCHNAAYVADNATGSWDRSEADAYEPMPGVAGVVSPLAGESDRLTRALDRADEGADGLDVERLGFTDLLSIGEALLEHYPPDTIVCSHSVQADIGAQTAAAIADVIASCRSRLTPQAGTSE